MDVQPRSGRRKRGVHLYLYADMVECLERVAADEGLSLSKVVETILGFHWEMNRLAERWRFLSEVNERFRRTG